MQKPLAAGQGKRFPARFCWLLWGEMYPAGRRGAWWGKIPKADDGGWAAPDPGLRRRRGGVSAGFESEGGHLVLLVANAQREMMHEAAKDGIGAVVERLKRRYVAFLPHEHSRCMGQVVGQLQRRAAAVLCLVEGCLPALSVLEN